MTTPDPATVAAIADGLTELEKELLLGTSPHWGSWMFSVGHDLVAKGLGRESDGNIFLDTPLGLAVKRHIEGTPDHA